MSAFPWVGGAFLLVVFCLQIRSHAYHRGWMDCFSKHFKDEP